MVVVPDVRIPAKTAALYARLGSNDFSDGSRIAAQAARLKAGLAPDMTLMANTFARPLYAMVPELAALPDIMRDAGAESVAISGSRPRALHPGHRFTVGRSRSRRASASGSVIALRSSSPGQ